jgi:hypothetical protein
MKVIAVMPGRFQPAHRGHLSIYDRLVEEFGEHNVFVATSDKTAPITSPFTFSDKVAMWAALGIPTSKVVKVKSPYNPIEITGEVPDPDDTALIIAVSEKDMTGDSARFKFGKKRDNSESYMQPYPGNTKSLDALTNHAYVYTVPTTNFKINEVDANSATEIRDAFLAGNAAARTNLIADLYGEDHSGLGRTFAQRLAVTESVSRVIRQATKNINETDSRTRVKIRSLIESVQQLEHAIDGSVYDEDLMSNYFKEK